MDMALNTLLVCSATYSIICPSYYLLFCKGSYYITLYLLFLVECDVLYHPWLDQMDPFILVGPGLQENTVGMGHSPNSI